MKKTAIEFLQQSFGYDFEKQRQFIIDQGVEEVTLKNGETVNSEEFCNNIKNYNAEKASN